MPDRSPQRLFRLHMLLALIVVAAGALVLYRAANPVSRLPPPDHNVQPEIVEPVIVKGRRLEHITLASTDFGEIGIFISLPDPLPAKRLPVVIVLGGLGTGETNVRTIENAGDNVIVGYDWPIPVHFPGGSEFIRQSPALYHQVLTIPEQVASAIGWIAAQPWADDRHISILGFSLGALAAPSVENVAEQDGHPIGWTILAYGGAPFGDLFAADPHIKPEWLRVAMGPVIDFLLRSVEPAANLPQLNSHFLVLEGRDDTLIPATARENLENEVPGSKDVVVFNGDHMGVGPDQTALLDQIIRVSRAWLIDNGAVNP
jgi:surfactin synthase thioesterase subunit